MALGKSLPTPLHSPGGTKGCTRDTALFVLVSASYQESGNSKNTVIHCDLFSSLVLQKLLSVRCVFPSVQLKAIAWLGTETRLCRTGVF